MNHLEHPDGSPARIGSIDAWSALRAEIVASFEEVAGALPRGTRCPLDPAEEEPEHDCGSYVRRRISYAATAGAAGEGGGGRTPAYLCVPKACLASPPLRCPAVLCLHGTDNEVGHGTVVGLSSRENRSTASELAERGFVTISPSYPLLANYQEPPSSRGFESGTMMAIWDNVRACDYLDTLGFVKRAGGYGAIGHSLGGHNAVWTALFEPRVTCVVSSCGLDSFRDYKGGDITGWTSNRYMPKLLDYPCIPGTSTPQVPFDWHDLVAAVAPRPCLICAPTGDTNFQWQSVARLTTAARRVYSLYPHPRPGTTTMGFR